jgi:hypothetical protein
MKNSKLVKDIKVLAQEQIDLKPQRKTINFSGIRVIDSWKAVQKANENKEKLRHLYVAYNILREKEVIPFTKRDYNKSLVDKYINDYREDFIKESEIVE